MRTAKCHQCNRNFTEADREWDLARESGACPFCESPLNKFSSGIHQRSTKMICSACGSAFQANDRFCSQCGSAIARPVVVSDRSQKILTTDRHVAERKEKKVSSPYAVARKWAYWPAALGLGAGISGAVKTTMKSGSGPLGGFILGLIFGSLLAAIFGGITFLVVWLIMVMKKR